MWRVLSSCDCAAHVYSVYDYQSAGGGRLNKLTATKNLDVCHAGLGRLKGWVDSKIKMKRDNTEACYYWTAITFNKLHVGM